MMKWTETGRGVGRAVVGLVATMAIAGPAAAQNVRLYKGTLQIGFGSAANQTLPPGNPGPDLANNGVPACANANPFVPATFATVKVHGFVSEGAGAAPRSLMFGGHAPVDWVGQSGGGMKPILAANCRVQFPPWLAANALRSRVQNGAQVWPGNALNGAATLFNGAAGGTVAANGGNAAQVTYHQTFYGTKPGQIKLIPGANRFGGGIPVNGGGNVLLGVNFARTVSGNPLVTFGIVPYANAVLPTGPAAYGTDAVGGPHPVGVRIGNPYTWVARTPGPQGSPLTIPLTPNGGWQQGATQMVVIGGVPRNVTTMGDFRGLFHKWTTGMVQHTDKSGSYTTIRNATGHDWTAGQFPGSVMINPNFGTSRKVQLVTPWSASIKKRGTNPFFAGSLAALPDFGFGGLAVLTLDIAPVPEPGAIAGLGVGALGLLGLAARRRSARR